MVYPDSNPHSILLSPPASTDFYVRRQDGSYLDLGFTQGGVFSDDGRLFYLTNGYYDCQAGADRGGLRVFDYLTGVMIAKAGNAYGYFDYENHCGALEYEEPEGLDYVNMDVRPGPYWGHLHVLLLSNAINDDVYLKHYSTH